MNNDYDETRDNEAMSVEELSTHSKLSAGLIRLAVDCGCPTEEGKLRPVAFSSWLVEHYPKVRQLAGLPNLPLVDESNPQRAACLHVGNSLLTITDYHASRVISPINQQAWRNVGVSLGLGSN